MRNPFAPEPRAAARVPAKVAPKAPRRRASAKEVAERQKLKLEAEQQRRDLEFLEDLKRAAPQEYVRLMLNRVNGTSAQPADPLDQFLAMQKKMRQAGMLGKPEPEDDAKDEPMAMSVARGVGMGMVD